MTIESFRKHASTIVSNGIGPSTARAWLLKMGFNVQKAGRGMFIDGHDREDVLNAREVYLLQSAEAHSRGYNFWRGIDVDNWAETEFRHNFGPMGGQLKEGDFRPVIGYYHDEVVYNANAGQNQYWAMESLVRGLKRLKDKVAW